MTKKWEGLQALEALKKWGGLKPSGLIEFYAYVNDIDDSVCNNLLKFADDAKVFNVVSDINDIKMLQNMI